MPSVNKGVPFVTSMPSARISQTIRDLARVVGAGDGDGAAAAALAGGAAGAAAGLAGGAAAGAAEGRDGSTRRRMGISGRILSILTGG